MEHFLLGVGLIALQWLWTFVFKATMLDHARDKLFDLRDNLRQSFIEKGWDISSDAYRHLRDLCNGYLRYTEDFAVWRSATLSSVLTGRESEWKNIERSVFEEKFAGATPEQREFVKSFRRSASDVVFIYASLSSRLLVLLLIPVLPILLIGKCFELTRKSADTVRHVLGESIRHLGLTTMGLVDQSALVLARHILAETEVESRSLALGESLSMQAGWSSHSDNAFSHRRMPRTAHQ